MSDNQITIFKSPHDKEHPYVMISRQMIQDKGLSLKARGLLCYLLSLPGDWQIYHSQLMNAIGCGESCLTTSLDELLEKGYARRERKRTDKGTYAPYRYEISEFKRFLPNDDIQPGLSRPENPDLQNTEAYEQNKQQQKVAAAVLEKSSKIHECLIEIEIPELDKIEISNMYPEPDVVHAIKFSRLPSTKITKSLAACIKWACKNKPKLEKTSTEKSYDNRKAAENIERNLMPNDTSKFLILNTYIEISTAGQEEPDILLFDDKEFTLKLPALMVKHHFRVK